MEESATGPVSSRSHRFIIIGYNRHTAHGLSIEQQVIERIQSFGLGNVHTVAVDDLTPELAKPLAAAEYAIFVAESRLGDQAGVNVRSLDASGTETAGSSVPAIGHSCTPRTLLALANSAYGHYPRAWLIQVSIPTDVTPSAEMIKTKIEQVTAEIEVLMQRYSR